MWPVRQSGAVMFLTYYKAKCAVIFAICGFFLLLIAQKELSWGFDYIETPGAITDLKQTCVGGRGTRYVKCSETTPGADRRTVIALDYVSPADHQQHQARVRCDTAAEMTPKLFFGGQLSVLAHKREPDRMDMRKCKSLTLDPSKDPRW